MVQELVATGPTLQGVTGPTLQREEYNEQRHAGAQLMVPTSSLPTPVPLGPAYS